MELLLNIVAHIAPLYILIIFGYIAGRWLDVNLNSIARITMYVLLPVVSFGAVVRMTFDPAFIALPFILSGLSIALTTLVFNVSKKIWHDGSANLVGAGTANGNAIYFGLPVIIYLFGAEGAGIYLFMNLGPQINNITLAYYLTARGRHTVKDSFMRVIKFPVVHVVWIAIIINLLGWKPPEVFTTYWEYAVGSLVYLGMMMVGIALAKLDKLEIDWGLMAGFFTAKFLLWPLACMGLIAIDHFSLHCFDMQVYQILMVFSATPLMGNLVAYAAECDLHPERAAAAVLASSIFAVVTMPAAYFLAAYLFGG